jgi:hypothetical protein
MDRSEYTANLHLAHQVPDVMLVDEHTALRESQQAYEANSRLWLASRRKPLWPKVLAVVASVMTVVAAILMAIH